MKRSKGILYFLLIANAVISHRGNAQPTFKDRIIKALNAEHALIERSVQAVKKLVDRVPLTVQDQQDLHSVGARIGLVTGTLTALGLGFLALFLVARRVTTVSGKPEGSASLLQQIVDDPQVQRMIQQTQATKAIPTVSQEGAQEWASGALSIEQREAIDASTKLEAERKKLKPAPPSKKTPTQYTEVQKGITKRRGAFEGEESEEESDEE